MSIERDTLAIVVAISRRAGDTLHLVEGRALGSGAGLLTVPSKPRSFNSSTFCFDNKGRLSGGALPSGWRTNWTTFTACAEMKDQNCNQFHLT